MTFEFLNNRTLNVRSYHVSVASVVSIIKAVFKYANSFKIKKEYCLLMTKKSQAII